MKRRKGKESWEEFERRVGLKRSGEEDRNRAPEKRALGKIPNDILVQRMSTTPSGRLKKYEPLDTRDFVPFSDYEELSIENIKDACEQFYSAPAGSCDILASDRGPSCTKMEQIKGKKVYFIRFLPPAEHDRSQQSRVQGSNSAPISPSKIGEIDGHHPETPSPKLARTVYPKSVSIGDLLRAGKLVRPPQLTTLSLEMFDVEKCEWIKTPLTLSVEIEETKFDSGAFRDAFRAKCTDKSSSLVGEWVIKKYRDEAITTIQEQLQMTVEDHTRKQVQMHAVARNLTARFSAKVPEEFGETFQYGKVFYSHWNECPVTVEEYVPGVFSKYINNDGDIIEPDDIESDEIFQKAQCLVHFTYMYSVKRLMVLDIQGSGYKLYDPEIVTTDLMATNDTSHE
ncbi:transient receptor potential cation channel subfamily M member 6-like, partial [Paramuricea clavata]